MAWWEPEVKPCSDTKPSTNKTLSSSHLVFVWSGYWWRYKAMIVSMMLMIMLLMILMTLKMLLLIPTIATSLSCRRPRVSASFNLTWKFKFWWHWYIMDVAQNIKRQWRWCCSKKRATSNGCLPSLASSSLSSRPKINPASGSIRLTHWRHRRTWSWR